MKETFKSSYLFMYPLTIQTTSQLTFLISDSEVYIYLILNSFLHQKYTSKWRPKSPPSKSPSPTPPSKLSKQNCQSLHSQMKSNSQTTGPTAPSSQTWSVSLPTGKKASTGEPKRRGWMRSYRNSWRQLRLMALVSWRCILCIREGRRGVFRCCFVMGVSVPTENWIRVSLIFYWKGQEVSSKSWKSFRYLQIRMALAHLFTL